jgi:hypothetical protein
MAGQAQSLGGDVPPALLAIHPAMVKRYASTAMIAAAAGRDRDSAPVTPAPFGRLIVPF